MPVLQIIVASTRPGRIGLPVARWFEGLAREHGAFEIDFADLAEINLPFLDEPKHPRLGDYEHEHTKAWSARVTKADAFAFVVPEYNHGMNAPIKNAIDYLHHEWRGKPVGIVSYGGVAAGTRAAQQIKQVVLPVGMIPLSAGVPIPFVSGFRNDDGDIEPNEPMNEGATRMLEELVKVEETTRPLRSGA